MAKKQFSPVQIFTYLRQVQILVSQGQTAGEACRQIGVMEQTYYR